MGMRGRTEFHVRDRVALDAVGAALQQDKLGFVFTQVVFHQRPYFLEHGVVGIGWNRNIQLGAFGVSTTGFINKAGAGIQRAAILVNVGMWFERYVIVITSLQRDFLPSSWGLFEMTFFDWSILAGSFGLFFTLFLLFVRFLPVIAMSEVKGVMDPKVARGAAEEASSEADEPQDDDSVDEEVKS